MSQQENLFKPIGQLAQDTDARPEVDDDDARLQEGGDFQEGNEREVEQVESLCMECHQQGITRMLLTSIPYFREVIIMSFRCDHCGNSNTEIQSAGEIQPKGCIYSVHILNAKDLNRQLVKSNTCTITIPEISLTLPASRGQLTNVEGLVSDIVRDLSLDQPVRKIMDPATHDKIETLLNRLKECLDDDDDEATTGEKPEKTFTPFTLKLDDPSGNSYVQFFGTTSDAQWSLRAYNRTREQNVTLGLVAEEEEASAAKKEPVGAIDGTRPSMTEREDGTVVPEEVFTFPGACSSCGHQIDTLMQRVNIPHFKDIIIMSTNCEYCGYRDNEVKSGGAIAEKGKKIILKVEDEEDLSRDLLKSETCGLEIPEIDLVLQPGTLGGRFTTMEGLLQQVYEELSTKVFNTGGGDSALTDSEDKGNFAKFLGSLKEVMVASRPFTLILDDPVANSYLQNIYAPDDDPNMEIITYDRTHEQNEDLGINDMVLTGYDNEHPEVAAEAGDKAE